jgi:hypothetical protein
MPSRRKMRSYDRQEANCGPREAGGNFQILAHLILQGHALGIEGPASVTKVS